MKTIFCIVLVLISMCAGVYAQSETDVFRPNIQSINFTQVTGLPGVAKTDAQMSFYANGQIVYFTETLSEPNSQANRVNTQTLSSVSYVYDLIGNSTQYSPALTGTANRQINLCLSLGNGITEMVLIKNRNVVISKQKIYPIDVNRTKVVVNYDASMKITSKLKKTYNDDNLLETQKEYDSAGGLTQTTRYYYDEKKCLSKYVVYNQKNEVTKKAFYTDYSLNAYGDWAQRQESIESPTVNGITPSPVITNQQRGMGYRGY